MLPQMALFHSLLWLSNPPLKVCVHLGIQEQICVNAYNSSWPIQSSQQGSFHSLIWEHLYLIELDQ